MKQLYKKGDNCYFIHRDILISHFADENGVLNMDNVKIWRDGLNGVDHVLRTDSHFLFVETIQEAKVIEE
jgi:hypothetical protein|tara:strand:- start:2085 stop:2294 length:210 start_codon:yes stop_codon:yes gene_type:complete